MNANHIASKALTLTLTHAMACLTFSAAWAGSQNHAVVESELSCPDPVRARQFINATLDPDSDYFLLNAAQVGPDAVFRCGCQASNGGVPERVKITFEPTLVDLDGNEIPLGTVRGRTNRRNGWFAAEFNSGGFGALVNEITFSGNREMDAANCYCSAGEPQAACVSGPTTGCADGTRFAVSADFEDPFDGRRRDMGVVASSRDSVTFSFAPADNSQLIVDILDHCSTPNFGHFWVFASATTDLEFDVIVTDTLTGVTRSYQNPDGTPFEPITDTRAFDTCP